LTPTYFGFRQLRTGRRTVRGCYVLCVDLSDITLLVDQLIGAGKQVSAGW